MVDPHRGDLRPQARTGSPARLPLPLLPRPPGSEETPHTGAARPRSSPYRLPQHKPRGSGGHTRLQLEPALTPPGKDETSSVPSPHRSAPSAALNHHLPPPLCTARLSREADLRTISAEAENNPAISLSLTLEESANM